MSISIWNVPPLYGVASGPWIVPSSFLPAELLYDDARFFVLLTLLELLAYSAGGGILRSTPRTQPGFAGKEGEILARGGAAAPHHGNARASASWPP